MSADVGAVGEERIGGYRYVRVLQMGQNSVIMEVKDESGKRFAMKQLLASRSAIPPFLASTAHWRRQRRPISIRASGIRSRRTGSSP